MSEMYRCNAPGSIYLYGRRVCNAPGARPKFTASLRAASKLNPQPMWLCSHHWGQVREIDFSNGLVKKRQRKFTDDF